MNSGRWERLEELFHAALALPDGERATFLTRSTAGDSALRDEIERLLSAHARAGRFIDEPAVVAAGAFSGRGAEPSAIGRQFGPWRVIREIGRGGMGAVYLAERADGQFEQRVAIKLIKRGMDTDLVVERFRAERQILASLDHPNVARLLDGGTTDDGVPYFVMEYIDGVPIDEYADARRLSVPDRLELFLQVCAAVAYAHGRLVIHRDIKPANILVAPSGAPKLLDFGIAKVFDPDGDERVSTLTGLRLLTPEYASPEQIEGRKATEASDVYSLGVVMYELLTGRSPYQLRSRDPAELAAAIRTTVPEAPSAALRRPSVATDPVSRRRADEDRVAATGATGIAHLQRRLRGDLDTIVLMALRKEPERRYARVSLLMDDIRQHLRGLPVSARRDDLRYRVAKFLRRNRGAVASVTLVGTAALLLGIAFTRMGVSSAALDARSGVLAVRDKVVVADLADRAGDASLASALTEALRVDLAESPRVQVFSSRQVRTSLSRMQRSPDLALEDSVARELAIREGVKAVVTGSVGRIAGRYAIAVQLLGAEKGDVLAAERETAADSTDVIEALGRLSQRVRRRMGESLGSVQASPPLAQVTTASLPALRAYTEGLHLINSGDRKAGLAMLEHAVVLDTAFASAWRALATTYGDVLEPGRAAAARKRAMANVSRLPFLERYLAIASSAMSEDYAASANAYGVILERYPDDVRALNNRALAYSWLGRFASQESLLVRAAALDSTVPSIQTQLAVAQANQGHFEDARRTLDRVKKNQPGNFYAQLAEIYLAAARQDWPESERQAEKRLRLHPTDTLDVIGGTEALAQIVMTQGRLAEAERLLRHAQQLSAAAGERMNYLLEAALLGWVELRYRRAPDKALRMVDEAVARFPLDSLAEAERPYDELARLYAAAGRPTRARALLAQAEGTTYGRRPNARPGRQWSLGAIALAEGHAADALGALHRAMDSAQCPICALPDLARAYEAASHTDSALATYESFIHQPWEWRFETDDIELAAALKRAGELSEGRGDAPRAAEMYERLLMLWSRADQELNPNVEWARAQLARLRELNPHRTRSP
ncbi:MAG: protein kinase [Gemmatimonadaceae bacterium]